MVLNGAYCADVCSFSISMSTLLHSRVAQPCCTAHHSRTRKRLSSGRSMRPVASMS